MASCRRARSRLSFDRLRNPALLKHSKVVVGAALRHARGPRQIDQVAWPDLGVQRPQHPAASRMADRPCQLDCPRAIHSMRASPVWDRGHRLARRAPRPLHRTGSCDPPSRSRAATHPAAPRRPRASRIDRPRRGPQRSPAPVVPQRARRRPPRRCRRSEGAPPSCSAHGKQLGRCAPTPSPSTRSESASSKRHGSAVMNSARCPGATRSPTR